MPRNQVTDEQATAAKLAQLQEDADLCVHSLPHIRDLMPEPDTGGPQTGTIGRHAPESSEPWQGAAAAVYWTIHYGARRLEDDLRRDLKLQPVTPPRGGSEANTISALLAIPRLATTLPADIISGTATSLARWARAVDQLDGLDAEHLAATEADWRPLPRRQETKPLPCPYCTTFSLRINLARMTVRCFNPGCLDKESHPPVARVANTRLVFRDGHSVVYRELAEIPA